jgi:hypothetical protein
MKRFHPIQLTGLMVIGVVSCGNSSLKGVEGRWAGQIVCQGEFSDLTLSLTVEDTLIYGPAQIRTKSSNSNYTARGSQNDTPRLVDCPDNTCQGNEDCSKWLDSLGEPDRSRCADNVCTPCFTKENWALITLTLKDDNVQIPDPTLELWRYSDQRLEGTIKKYCPNEAVQNPQVTLTKE